MTRVAVGSENPVKVAAAERVAGWLFGRDGSTGGTDGSADGRDASAGSRERSAGGHDGSAGDRNGSVGDGASDPTVAGVGVDSGISEQPVGRAETVSGAENRAARALDADGEADYGVGVEGGVEALDGRPGLYVIMWAAVSDGDRLERAAGPAIRLPDALAGRIRDGEELGPVLDDLLGIDGVGECGGAAGVLTDGAIDRESALEHAVACAFGPFVVDLYGE